MLICSGEDIPVRQQSNEVQLRLADDMIVSSDGMKPTRCDHCLAITAWKARSLPITNPKPAIGIACRAHEQYHRSQHQRSQIHLSRAAKSGLKGVRELLAAISIVRAGNTATNALKEGGLRNAL